MLKAKEIGFEGQTTVIEYDCDPLQPLESDTVAEKLKVPVAVGVPEIVPVEDKVKPGGSAPAVTAKLGVPKAPVCVSVVEQEVPAAPPVKAPPAVIVNAGQL